MIQLQFDAVLRAGFARALVGAAFFAGCAATSASAAPMVDPVGDAACVLSNGSSCAVPYDITLIDAATANGSISFRTYLNQNIVQVPSQDPSSASQFGGYIDIDTDQNLNTGTFAWGDYFGEAPPWPDPTDRRSGLGVDYYVDLYSEAYHAGMVDVYNGPGTTLLGQASILYGTNWIDVIVPLTLLGNDDGIVNYDVVVGDGTGLTDQAVDYQVVLAGGQPAASEMPEPSSAGLFGLILGGIGFVRRRSQAT